MTPLILYHDSLDGACAAWCVLQQHPDAECEADVGEVALERVKSRDVWAVGLRWPERALSIICSASRRFNDYSNIGCGSVWDALCEEREPRPWFVDYIEDAALGRYELPDSRAVSAYLGTLEGGPERFEKLNLEWFGRTMRDFGGEPPDQPLVAGQAILRYQARLVRQIYERARMERLPWKQDDDGLHRRAVKGRSCSTCRWLESDALCFLTDRPVGLTDGERCKLWDAESFKGARKDGPPLVMYLAAPPED